MPAAERSIVIARPVEEVFAFFTDPANDPRWRSGVASIEASRPLAVGTVVSQRVKVPGGRSVAADIEVTAYHPHREYSFKGVSGPVRPVGRYLFEPVEGGTRVTFSLATELTGVKKAFMGKPVQRSMEAEMAGLDRAKAALESA